MLGELGMSIDGGIHMQTDAPAAIGVAKRAGVGKLRHLHVCFSLDTGASQAGQHYSS